MKDSIKGFTGVLEFFKSKSEFEKQNIIFLKKVKFIHPFYTDLEFNEKKEE